MFQKQFLIQILFEFFQMFQDCLVWGVWGVGYGVWCVVCGVWCVVCGVVCHLSFSNIVYKCLLD
jgi:hypothetical protein